MENKILIIDPNSNINNGITTPEQLTISVELKAIKKDRSAISISNGKAMVKIGDNSSPISFLGGSDVGNNDGKNSLTTHYTELGTNFNSENKDLETLGIKDIQIEFNTACAPLIVINFVDVRGKLFEMGKNSPYSVFWELPYPIFELTVKGYYGKAVTYKLHLTKFNGGFDYSTGNFEIQCNFIGYTYAFLSDIIMGHLKGITYTERGIAKIEQKKLDNQGVHQFFTFRELNQIITNVSISADDIKNNNKSLKAIKKADDVVEELQNFKENLLSTISIVGNHRRINNDSIQGFYAFKSPESNNFIVNNSEFDSDVETFNKNVIEKLNDLNNESLDTGYKLTESNFILKRGVTIHDGINKIDFSGDVTNYISKVSNQVRYIEELSDEEKYRIFKNWVYSIKENDIMFDLNFTVIQIFEGLKEIDTLIERIRLERKEKFVKLGEEFINSDVFKLDNKYFNPSIGNIINLICDHVDILMDCIRDVAVEAEKDPKVRENDLRNIAGILDEIDGQLGNLKAFPTYSEIEDGVYVDKWIGNVAPNIPEVRFIEDLLEGIIKANQEDIKTISNLEINNLSKPQWFPVNTFDNPIFGTTNPYSKLSDVATVDDYLRLIILRAMIYFYTSNSVTNQEIINMAKMEANNLFENISNVDIKNAIRVYANSGRATLLNEASNGVKFKNYTSEGGYNQSPQDFNKSAIITNLTQTTNFSINTTQTSSEYVYVYSPIISGNTLNYNKVFLPLTVNNFKEYNSDFLLKDGSTIIPNSDRIELRNSGVVFFTNQDNNQITGADDGSTSIKILNSTKDIENKVFFPSYGDGIMETQLMNVDLNNNIINGGPLNYFFKGNGDGYINLPMGYFFYDKEFNFVVDVNKEETFKDFWTNEDIRYKNNYFDNTIDSSPNKNRSTITTNTDTDNLVKALMKFKDPINLRKAFVKDYNKYYVPHIGFKIANNIAQYYSLFGSDLYYSQNDIKSKAYLFLHSIPFTNLSGGKLFDSKLIGKLFKQKGGFVEVPYSWALFIGALLSRRAGNFNVLFGDQNMSFLYELPKNSYPSLNEFCVADIGDGWFNFDDDGYQSIDTEILGLPQSAKDEFINLFNNWAITEYQFLADDLEIFNVGTTKNQIRNFWVQYNTTPFDTIINNPIIKNNFKSNYSLISRISDGYENDATLTSILNNIISKDNGSPFNFLLEIRRGSEAGKKVINFLSKTRVIASASGRVWQSGFVKYNLNRPITVDNSKLETYLDSFFTEYIKVSKNIDFVEKVEERAIKENIFQTINNDDIKLNLYIKIKSIYDKWICGSDERYLDVNSGELYDTFKFIDRSYTNIEDKFKVNIIPMVAQLTENYNQSFYNYLARVLGDNNFDFFPLPSFINYNDSDEVKKVFNTYTYNNMETSIKPQFICMYIGEKSNALGESVNFKNNSFNFNDNSLPADFQSGDKNIPIFLVQYGAQDQSIFKDLKLTQSEFTATDESLTITDAISKQSNTSTSMGQNLFDVYINRSYTCHVEMLGNIMIQPLMYFQLDGVPMFRGAYTIIKVTHSIKPNTMTTNFTGVRMRLNKTKMIDEAILIKNMLGDIGDVSSEGGNLNDLNTNTTTTNNEIPNTVAVSNLKGQINQTEFDKNKNKFNQYE